MISLQTLLSSAAPSGVRNMARISSSVCGLLNSAVMELETPPANDRAPARAVAAGGSAAGPDVNLNHWTLPRAMFDFRPPAGQTTKLVGLWLTKTPVTKDPLFKARVIWVTALEG